MNDEQMAERLRANLAALMRTISAAGVQGIGVQIDFIESVAVGELISEWESSIKIYKPL